MPKPKYIYFGGKIPKKIEIAYRNLLRHEAYLEEQDIKNGLLHIEDCTFLPVGDDRSPQIVDERTIPKTKSEEIWLERLNYLPIALEKLKFEYPHYYKIVNDYYFSGKKITLSDLAEKYHISYQALSETLRRARRKLKIYIIAHEKDS